MNKHTDELLDAVHSIATMIHYQMPLKYQDKWLEDIKAKGIWKPDEDESKPTWDNFWICNCEHGHQNCKCDGETGKKVRE